MDVIVDIDGTIADMRHRRHLVGMKEDNDWKRFFELMVDDKPIYPVLTICCGLHYHGHKIILCTGRPEEYRPQTVEWLANVCEFMIRVPLYMRQEKDYRPDYVVKEEMLSRMRSDGYSPQLALEDKQECVEMWRRNGILTLQNSMRDMP